MGGFPKCLCFGKIDAVFGLVRLAFGGIEFERHGIVLMRLGEEVILREQGLSTGDAMTQLEERAFDREEENRGDGVNAEFDADDRRHGR